jgi:hypothetical protein
MFPPLSSAEAEGLTIFGIQKSLRGSHDDGRLVSHPIAILGEKLRILNAEIPYTAPRLYVCLPANRYHVTIQSRSSW